MTTTTTSIPSTQAGAHQPVQHTTHGNYSDKTNLLVENRQSHWESSSIAEEALAFGTAKAPSLTAGETVESTPPTHAPLPPTARGRGESKRDAGTHFH